MNVIATFRKHKFLFDELVKRDFKKKYKGTFLGVTWSMLAPLLQLLVMNIVFKQFFGRVGNHWIIYLFSGQLMFSYFREATSSGMTALESNAAILTKVNVPKYLFLLAKNVTVIINLAFTLIVYYIFVFADGVPFSWRFFLILFPLITETVFNVGVGFVLSALHIFFKDISYLWNVVTLLLMYMSAIFYYTTAYPASMQNFFYLNPCYCYITYVRQIMIDSVTPSPWLHLLCIFYALLFLGIGILMYKKYNYKFMYYI